MNQEVKFHDIALFINCTANLHSYGIFDFFFQNSLKNHLVFENCLISGALSKPLKKFLYVSGYFDLTLLNCEFKNFFFNSSMFESNNSYLEFPQEYHQIKIESCRFSNIIFNQLVFGNSFLILDYMDWNNEKNSVLLSIKHIDVNLTIMNQTFLSIYGQIYLSLENIAIVTESKSTAIFMEQINEISIKNSYFESNSTSLQFRIASTISIENCSFKGLIPISIDNSKVRIVDSYFSTFIDGFIINFEDFVRIVFSNVTCNLAGISNPSYLKSPNYPSVYGLFSFHNFVSRNFLIIKNLRVFILPTYVYYISAIFIMSSPALNYYAKVASILVYNLEITDIYNTFEDYFLTDPNLKNSVYLESYLNDDSCLINNSRRCSKNEKIQCLAPNYLSSINCIECKYSFKNGWCQNCAYNEDFELVCLQWAPWPTENLTFLLPCILLPFFIFVFVIWMRWRDKRRSVSVKKNESALRVSINKV